MMLRLDGRSCRRVRPVEGLPILADARPQIVARFESARADGVAGDARRADFRAFLAADSRRDYYTAGRISPISPSFDTPADASPEGAARLPPRGSPLILFNYHSLSFSICFALYRLAGLSRRASGDFTLRFIADDMTTPARYRAELPRPAFILSAAAMLASARRLVIGAH